MYCLVFFFCSHTLFPHERGDGIVTSNWRLFKSMSQSVHDKHVEDRRYCRIFLFNSCPFSHFNFKAFIFDSSTTVHSRVKWWFLVTFCSFLLKRVESTRKKNQSEARQHDTITYCIKWHGSKYFWGDNSSLFSQCRMLAKLKWTQNWNADCYNGVKLLRLWKAGRNKLSANDCQSFQSI